MSKKMALITTLFTVILSILCFSLMQIAREVLNNYILELQRNPNDNALREKIMKYVADNEVCAFGF